LAALLETELLLFLAMGLQALVDGRLFYRMWVSGLAWCNGRGRGAAEKHTL